MSEFHPMTKQEYIESVRRILKQMERHEGGSLRSDAFHIADIMRNLVTEVDEGRIR